MSAPESQAPLYGFTGKVLHVDLSTETLSIEEPSKLFYRTYMGGWGFVAYYLLKELPAATSALDPANLLIFATGAITGVPIAGSGRSVVGAKSPLTGGFGASEAGGWFGAELTHAGFDAVVIRGRASRPVYLWIVNGHAELRPAEHLWGKLTADTEAALRQELGDPRVRIAQIGPAGERLSPIAAVMHDVTRAAGRCGLGAVMGSKNLKAVAVRGTGRLELADREAVLEFARWYSGTYKTTSAGNLHELGTPGNVLNLNAIGGLPTRNFQEGAFEAAEQISGERMRDTILKDRDSCYSCPVYCKRVVEVREGPYTADPVYGGPEYETIGAFGSGCGVGDLSAIAKANQLCNAYGLDTISAGVTISWAMECFKRGLLTSEDTGGLTLRFGDAASMVRAVELMCRREGWGRLLSEGAYRAAQAVGRGTEAYVMHVKGQPIPLHEPRVKFGLGLGYVLSPTGADHIHNIHDSGYVNESGLARVRLLGILEPVPFNSLGPAKVRLMKTHITAAMLANTLGCCSMVLNSYPRPRLPELIAAITGWDTSLVELIAAGERSYTLARAFDAREGLTAADDRLPSRYFQALAQGPSAGQALSAEEFERARILFYQMMGWDADTGTPMEWKLHELGVGWVADELRRHGKL